MKRRISIILLLIATLTFSLLTFTACGNGNDENGAKQVPVYQGMTITKSNSVLSLASYRMSGITLLSANNENNGDNGNHYGHYKGDHTDRNDTIDEDNPYPDNNANENIEEEIKSSLNVVGSPDKIYYATPNEDVYINIHIDNPDSFEIMSFTLNGKKYSSYMFEEGSDMETIVLKYNVGDATGIVEYTIDAVKYIDGTEIKDVIIDGNKTVMAGIRTENQVVASVTDVDIDTNALSFNVNVKDNNSLIEFSKGALKAVIYDGFNIISEKDIAVGNNSVIFDGLKTNTVYQYAVVGYYDDLSGNGFAMNILYKDAFYTDSVVLFDNINVGKESLNFSFLWHEDHQNKSVSSLKLYKGDAFVKDIDGNVTSVSELLSNTTYKLVAEYPNGDNTESIYIEFTTLAKATPEISVVNPTKTQTSIGFEINETDADNVGAVTKIELVHANGTVAADSLDQRTFANLLSNNAYTVKVTYVYDLNDGEGEHTVTREISITTLAKATPEISVVNPTKTQTSIGFEINETDADNVGAVTKIELVHANGTVSAASLDQRTFEGLLSNNAYTIRVTYLYDLNDGVGERGIIEELEITTNAKAVPSFAVKNENVTTDSVTAEYDIIDVDNILASYKVELYQGTTLVLENAEKRIAFASLNYYTDYTLKITYTYNLNDGKGVQTSIFEKIYKTLPFIDVVECNVANTSAVSEGDTIFMSVKLDNPLGMTIESVVINGETYGVTGASTKNKIFVEIVYNGQFAGGDTYLKVDKVNAKLESTALTIEPQTELSDNVFINGKVEVISIEYVDANFNPIEDGSWMFPSKIIYALVTIDNPTGYIIDSLSGYTKLDDNHYYCPASWIGWSPEVSISNISYHNKYISREYSITTIKNAGVFYRVCSDEVKYISTPDDLKNMSSCYYYELTNDIDLSGIEWKGDMFDGVFDGKGYAIKNMSFVGTINNQNAYLGLFTTGTGIIQNVKIEEATIIADVTADTANWYSAYCGAFIADGSNSRMIVIDHCEVDEYTTISVKNQTGQSCVGGFVGQVEDTSIGNYYNNDRIVISNSINRGSVSSDGYAGGLVGNIYSVAATIENCYNAGDVYSNINAGGLIGSFTQKALIVINSYNMGNISADSLAGGLIGSACDTLTFVNSNNKGFVFGKTCAGGIVGCAWSGTTADTNLTITDSYNIGDISSNSRAGGFVGEFSSWSLVASFVNSYNAGDISADFYAGGLIGYAYSASTIKNSYNCGNVSGNKSGGLIGDEESKNIVTVTGSYSLVSGNFGYNGSSCAISQLNSKEFYTETLGWSKDIWDFSELDVENGKYPKLKQ